MFGGAHFHRSTHLHTAVHERLWMFDFDQLEWSTLSSLAMSRPTYFHAAAMNEVRMLVTSLARLTLT